MLKKGIAIFAIAVMMTTTVAYSSPPNDTGTVVIQKKKTYVYIAPYSGTKYHAKKSCRGLPAGDRGTGEHRAPAGPGTRTR